MAKVEMISVCFRATKSSLILQPALSSCQALLYRPTATIHCRHFLLALLDIFVDGLGLTELQGSPCDSVAALSEIVTLRTSYAALTSEDRRHWMIV